MEHLLIVQAVGILKFVNPEKDIEPGQAKETACIRSIRPTVTQSEFVVEVEPDIFAPLTVGVDDDGRAYIYPVPT